MRAFVIFLMSLLFLVSCGEMDQEEEVQNDRRDRPSARSFKHRDKTPVVVNIPPSAKESQKLSGDQIWQCQKGSEVMKYIVNSKPVSFDGEGAEVRQRVCELFREHKKDIKLLNYAHWERDFCAKKLTKLIGDHTAEGWHCYGQ